MGKALEKNGRLQDALAHFRTSWELDPQNHDSLFEYERMLGASRQSVTPETTTH
jgi:cytochrome c-type biogenesis protein CcmH/NrfG